MKKVDKRQTFNSFMKKYLQGNQSRHVKELLPKMKQVWGVVSDAKTLVDFAHQNPHVWARMVWGLYNEMPSLSATLGFREENLEIVRTRQGPQLLQMTEMGSYKYIDPKKIKPMTQRQSIWIGKKTSLLSETLMKMRGRGTMTETRAVHTADAGRTNLQKILELIDNKTTRPELLGECDYLDSLQGLYLEAHETIYAADYEKLETDLLYIKGILETVNEFIPIPNLIKWFNSEHEKHRRFIHEHLSAVKKKFGYKDGHIPLAFNEQEATEWMRTINATYKELRFRVVEAKKQLAQEMRKIADEASDREPKASATRVQSVYEAYQSLNEKEKTMFMQQVFKDKDPKAYSEMMSAIRQTIKKRR